MAKMASMQECLNRMHSILSIAMCLQKIGNFQAMPPALRKMLFLAFVIHLLSCFSYISVDASPTPAENIAARPPLPSIGTVNLSAIMPPPGFSIAIESKSGKEPIEAKWIFKLIFTALYDLAIKDYEHVYPTLTRTIYADYEMHNYATLVISGARPQREWYVKHAVWGLTLAVQLMVQQHDYRNWRFALLWQNEDVGMLNFRLGSFSASQDIDENTTRLLQNETQTSPTSLSSFNPGNPVPDTRIQTFYFGRPVPFTDTMLAFIGGLTSTARIPVEEVVNHLSFHGIFPGFPRAIFQLLAPSPSAFLVSQMLCLLAHSNWVKYVKDPGGLTESMIVITKVPEEVVVAQGEMMGVVVGGVGSVGEAVASS